MWYPKLQCKHYYSTPELKHNTGDIWMNLPTFGLLKPARCSGIIITPSCDLCNNKVETITYLPILPITSWFCSRSFYAKIREYLKKIDGELTAELFAKNHLPNSADLIHAESRFKSRHTVQSPKIDAYFTFIKKIVEPKCTHISSKDLCCLSNASDILTRIINNSYQSDIHFLPQDVANIDTTAIPCHSVALFRYPITVPIEILDLASDYNCIDWESSITSLVSLFGIAEEFKSLRPLKTTRLNPDFLSDLLSRYVALYARIGSPDFTKDVVDNIKSEIL